MARELELELPIDPSQVDLDVLISRFPDLRKIRFKSFREDWQCTLELKQRPSSFPWSLQLSSIHKERSVTGLCLVDPAFAIAGPCQKFTLTSIRSEHGNVFGDIVFAGIISEGDVTEIGRDIFSTIRRFEFNMLPGDWQQTLLAILPAMPNLRRLRLFNPGPRPYLEADTISRAIKEHCPDLDTLECQSDWPVQVDLLGSTGFWDLTKELVIKIDVYDHSVADGLEDLVQQSLESRWTGRKLQTIHLAIDYQPLYSPQDYAIEFRSVLPFCHISVKYRGDHHTPLVAQHLAELNHLLEKRHYASVESLTAARLIDLSDV